MFKFLSKKGLYVLLLPAFFVVHGYAENFGLIHPNDCLILLLTYWAGALVIYLLSWWLLFRNPIKASLFTGYLLFLYLFFGAIDDFFKAHLFLLSRYSIIIPVYFLSIFLLIIYLHKTKSVFYRLSFFLNILLLIYLFVDTISIVFSSIFPSDDKLSIYGVENSTHYKSCDSCKNPDIYFLLFDEYSSSEDLQNTFNYNNNALDSFLRQKDFSIQKHSRSNYNFTPFSMAAILNMNYIKGIKNTNACTIQDYVHCNNLIRNNAVIRFLSSRKYDVVNYSIFDLAGNPALIESSLLPVKTRLLTDQTLFNRIIHDLGWNLYMGRFEIKWLSRNIIYGTLQNNNTIIQWVKTESSRQSGHPRFVYAHLEMPHPPFYFDKKFQPRDERLLIAEKKKTNIESYKGYLPYTNRQIEELVDTIQKNTKHSAVIILMGDHGFRVELGSTSQNHQFKNLNAVYFPDKDYRLMTDDITGVNQFRAILNTLYAQQLPMLKDTSVFLRDQP